MLHYCERLNKLEAETLEMRRLKLDLVMYYNILHGFVDIDAGSLFDTINCNVIRSRGHPLRIIKQHCNVNCRSSSFVCRNVNAWKICRSMLLILKLLPLLNVDCKSVIVFYFLTGSGKSPLRPHSALAFRLYTFLLYVFIC